MSTSRYFSVQGISRTKSDKAFQKASSGTGPGNKGANGQTPNSSGLGLK